MEPLSRFRRLLVYLGLYTLGLALLIVSLSVPFWETMASDHQGLWASCRNGSCYAWSDERLLQVANVSHDLPSELLRTLIPAQQPPCDPPTFLLFQRCRMP